jgi:hypothetical protein
MFVIPHETFQGGDGKQNPWLQALGRGLAKAANAPCELIMIPSREFTYAPHQRPHKVTIGARVSEIPDGAFTEDDPDWHDVCRLQDDCALTVEMLRAYIRVTRHEA